MIISIITLWHKYWLYSHICVSYLFWMSHFYVNFNFFVLIYNNILYVIINWLIFMMFFFLFQCLSIKSNRFSYINTLDSTYCIYCKNFSLESLKCSIYSIMIQSNSGGFIIPFTILFFRYHYFILLTGTPSATFNSIDESEQLDFVPKLRGNCTFCHWV